MPCPFNCTHGGLFVRDCTLLQALQQVDVSQPPQPCPHCGQLVYASLQEDHLEICELAPVPCPFQCLAVLPRWQLATHLTQTCPQHTFFCASFACTRPDSKWEEEEEEGVGGGYFGEWSWRGRAKRLMEVAQTGCRVSGGEGVREQQLQHYHLHRQRVEEEAKQLLHLPTASLSSESSACSSSSSSLPPSPLQLRSCPCCLERMLVAVAPPPIRINISMEHTKRPLPLGELPGEEREEERGHQHTEEEGAAVAQDLLAGWERVLHPVRLSRPPPVLHHPPPQLVFSPQDFDAHVTQCGPEGNSGIFKKRVSIPDWSGGDTAPTQQGYTQGREPQTEGTTDGTHNSKTSASTSPPLFSPLSSPLSFSRLLSHRLLLRHLHLHSSPVPRSTYADWGFSRQQWEREEQKSTRVSDRLSAIEQLLRADMYCWDVVYELYEHGGQQGYAPGVWSLKAAVRSHPLWQSQPVSLPFDQFHRSIAPVLRQWLQPLVEEQLIPDLARMVLDCL